MLGAEWDKRGGGLWPKKYGDPSCSTLSYIKSCFLGDFYSREVFENVFLGKVPALLKERSSWRELTGLIDSSLYSLTTGQSPA